MQQQYEVVKKVKHLYIVTFPTARHVINSGFVVNRTNGRTTL